VQENIEFIKFGTFPFSSKFIRIISQFKTTKYKVRLYCCAGNWPDNEGIMQDITP